MGSLDSVGLYIRDFFEPFKARLHCRAHTLGDLDGGVVGILAAIAPTQRCCHPVGDDAGAHHQSGSRRGRSLVGSVAGDVLVDDT